MPSRRIRALSLFFAFGCVTSGTTAAMLLFPSSGLQVLWKLNPHARAGLTTMGFWAVLLMTGVSIACAAAAVGLWRYTRWGFWTALVILVSNLAGDTVNALVNRDWRMLIGLPVGGLLIWFLVKQRHLLRHRVDS